MIEELIREKVREIPDFPKEGILFKDITPLLACVKTRQEILDNLYQKAQPLNIDVVVGIESRGFLFGMPLAEKLGVPFVPIRKAGKLPHTTIQQTYDLEYGSATVEIHEDAIPKGSRVLIHDDLLATGGTARAAAQLVGKLSGEVAAFNFLIELGFLKGGDTLKEFSTNIISLTTY